MIAAGLCMMGGCFAQDENGSAAETYWPAHSVSPLSLVNFSTAFPVFPLVGKAGRLFARLENVKWVRNNGQVVFWGAWESTYLCFMYLGCVDGPYIHLEHKPQTQIKLSINANQPLPWEELQYQDNKLTLNSSYGRREQDLSALSSFDAVDLYWNARIQNAYGSADVVAYAGNMPDAPCRFCIQPMRSASGATAFFDVDNPELIEQ